jgi:hypothetical protein
MLDTLAKIYDDGGRLVSVTFTLFDGDPRFVTAIGLRFESLSAVFRAVPDDDTLAVSLGPLEPDPDETLIEVVNSTPWSACIGLGICWAWRLTNQQGYSDGVRLEFSEPGEESGATVELVVVASAIHVFVVVPSDAA